MSGASDRNPALVSFASGLSFDLMSVICKKSYKNLISFYNAANEIADRACRNNKRPEESVFIS